jgi:hypothetical protein
LCRYGAPAPFRPPSSNGKPANIKVEL